jgi:hypothetical protein
LLGAVECEADLQRVWEYLILGKPVIVFGSTPEIASRAVLELSWLVRRFTSPPLIPYISVSDPRFPLLVKEPEGIIGVSNPIAPSLMSKESVLVRVGFPERGFRFPFTGVKNSRERFYGLLRNTEALALAVGDAMEVNGIGPKMIGRKLALRRVETEGGIGDFAVRLVRSQVFGAFVAERKRRLSMDR